MTRKTYQPTEKQNTNWSNFSAEHPLPGKEFFQTEWARKHHGKTAGWGMGKRDYILSNMTSTREYQMGLWQARTDFVQGLDYQEKLADGDNCNCYNLGYYRGWHDGEPLKGIDNATVARLTEQYGKEN